MHNVIVSTTINPPTEALEKFADIGWDMIIIGDMKTPHQNYQRFIKKYPHVTYIGPLKQDDLYPKVSELIGWNCIQRRSIGFLEAYKKKYDVIATVDDDNIPLDNWGKDVLVGTTRPVFSYNTHCKVFDPLMAVKKPRLWHRGFPIQLLNERVYEEGLREVTVEVQADLWNGAPDIDAICRVSNPEDVEFDVTVPFTSNALCPFNSQNTFLSRKALENYFLFPHIGRMDDIWAGYVMQEYLPGTVIYSPPSVFQQRNPHTIVKDLKDEMIGYEHSLELVNDLYYWTRYLPEKTQEFVTAYTEELSKLK